MTDAEWKVIETLAMAVAVALVSPRPEVAYLDRIQTALEAARRERERMNKEMGR